MRLLRNKDSYGHEGKRPSKGRGRAAIAVLVAIASSTVLPLSPASAESTVTQIAEGFTGPLQIAVGSNRTVYVAQSFSGTLTSIDRDGRRTDLATALEGGEIAGVDAQGRGTLVYLSSNDTEEGPATYGTLNRLTPNGRTRVLADLFEYESTVNPDQTNQYGFNPPLPQDCAWPDEFGPSTYTGFVDTHPYAVAIGSGGFYVADAAGNDIVHVGSNGQPSTVAVLPPQPFEVTEDVAAQFGLDDCTIGRTFAAEPVPTDIEIGSDGTLYVTTLSGSDNIGSVYRIDPNTGASSLIATGFNNATNLAIGSDGTIYVAELFGNQVSKIVDGTKVKVVDINEPASLEFASGKLYVSYDTFGNGKVGIINL